MDELVKRLRCLKYGHCPDCPMWYSEEVEPNLWRERCAAIDAADAIEELSKRVPPVPHGDLIDRDALCDGLVSNHSVVIHAKSAPTIIPAEEGE